MAGRWLSWRTACDRYALSEATLRRLVKLGRWPAGEFITKGKRVFSEALCDKAFEALLAESRAGRRTDTTPAKQKKHAPEAQA